MAHDRWATPRASEPLRTALDRLQPDAPDELVSALEPLAHGKTPDSLSTSGYVVHSLQTAMHDGLTSDSAEEAIVTDVLSDRDSVMGVNLVKENNSVKTGLMNSGRISSTINRGQS